MPPRTPGAASLSDRLPLEVPDTSSASALADSFSAADAAAAAASADAPAVSDFGDFSEEGPSAWFMPTVGTSSGAAFD
ncbi:hypothetical protein [Nocardia mangyaensis]|uniref:hypothetical protein n=1 Tax=Nocardia mangyaensis TaxID=2213200 RepID=UPI0026768163|nr:hypothetical protein [Nocardia mangyaensis]MDO3651017.1 hypothetical protein [Nocardia mangyaensis]